MPGLDAWTDNNKDTTPGKIAMLKEVHAWIQATKDAAADEEEEEEEE